MARTLGFLGISNSPIGLILVHTVYGLGFTTLFLEIIMFQYLMKL